MQVEFNTARMRALLEVWKQNADLQSPMSDDLKIIMMVGRRKLLDTHLDIAAVLSQMLELMTPIDDAAELRITRDAVGEFSAWAEAGLIEMARLARAD